MIYEKEERGLSAPEVILDDVQERDADLIVVGWPVPRVAADLEADRGPVLITVEYTLVAAREPEFRQAMERLRRARKRQGAYFWDLFVDAEAPGRYLEVFLEDSWLEHLRHHQRVTEEDRRSEAAVESLIKPGSRVVVRHLLSITHNRATRGSREGHRPDESRDAETDGTLYKQK